MKNQLNFLNKIIAIKVKLLIQYKIINIINHY